jgi:hypothetical protein
MTRRFQMSTKLLTSTLLAASLIAAPAVAFAQAESAAPPAASEANPGMTAPKTTHHVSSTGGHFRAGTTTGLGSQGAGRARPGGQSVARKPSGS